MSACLTFNDFTLGYDSHAAVHHLNGPLRHGSLTAVVGENGSGKSTLMKGIAGLLAPMAGACVKHDSCRIAYLPQISELDRSFPARVIDLVMLGLWPKRGLLGRLTGDDKAAVAAALKAVGMEGFENRALDTLSGGQMQRALFARVIVQDADLILLDEPFNAVDAKTLADLIAVLKGWHGEGRTIVAVLHDLELVRAHFPETLLLARAPVAWCATDEALTQANLKAARTFAEAWDETAPWCDDHDTEAHIHAGAGNGDADPHHVGHHGHGHEHTHRHGHGNDGGRSHGHAHAPAHEARDRSHPGQRGAA
jgi:zinc/manganese transport system ATP-binding protein